MKYGKNGNDLFMDFTIIVYKNVYFWLLKSESSNKN